MTESANSRRQFLKTAGVTAGAAVLSPGTSFGRGLMAPQAGMAALAADTGAADYTLRIKTCPVEIAPNRIVSLTTYNGQFPGPLLRFKEGQQVTIDIFNDSERPEQLHWHGQFVSTDVGWGLRRGHPFYSCSWQAANPVCAQTVGDSFLSHARSRRSKSFRGHVRRPSRNGLHRTEK